VTVSANDQVWLASHSFICALLKLKREHGFWFTGNQSWNLMKWNACGSVMISKEAISQFISNPTVTKGSKASEFGGGAGARCFVAEHIYPSKQLKTLVLKKFEDCDPTLEELKALFSNFNRICYVWHEEDKRLTSLGLRSSSPVGSELEDLYARYEAAEISAVPTNFSHGRHLFKHLEACRSDHFDAAQIVRNISQ